MVRNRTLNRMGKRRFLKTLAAFGVTRPTLSTISKEDLFKHTENLNNEIPYIMAWKKIGNGDRKPLYGTIDRERWAKIKAVQNASKKLHHQLTTVLDTAYITVGCRFGSEPMLVVKRVTKKKSTKKGRVTNSPPFKRKQLDQTLPGTVSGEFKTGQNRYVIENIPVVVRDITREDHYDAYYDYDYDPVPGGAQFDHGTLMCRAQLNGSGQMVLLASGHGLKGAYQNTDDLQQPLTGDVIGDWDTIEYWRQDDATDITDFGYFETRSTVDISDRLAMDQNNSYKSSVWGAVSWDWITTHTNSATVHKQGEHTGVTSGEIVEVENDRGQKAFWNQANTKSGDSGGPHYTYINGDLYIVGVNSWGVDVGSTPEDDGLRSGGNSAEKIEDTANLIIY